MKQLFFLLPFALFALRAQSQELLNADKNQITKYMAGKGGILRDDRIIPYGLHHGPENVLFYTFPAAKIKSDDMYSMMFLTLHNKCYKYLIKYAGTRFLDTLEHKFDKRNSGLTRASSNLKWINAAKKYGVEILMNTRIDDKGNVIKTGTFMLEIYKTDD